MCIRDSVPAIHALLCRQDVDARDKRGHDGGVWCDVCESFDQSLVRSLGFSIATHSTSISSAQTSSAPRADRADFQITLSLLPGFRPGSSLPPLREAERRNGAGNIWHLLEVPRAV